MTIQNPTEEIKKIEKEIESLSRPKRLISRKSIKFFCNEAYEYIDILKAKLEILKLWEQDRKELEKEIQFKENRISDLLVERDMGKWKDKFRKETLKLIDKFIEEGDWRREARGSILNRIKELKQKLGEIGGKNEQMAKTYQGYS